MTAAHSDLTALTGNLKLDSYDSRALGRVTANPDCGSLPVAAALGISPDTLARRAHELGIGPEPDRGMSQIANQQGRVFDANMLDTGDPLRVALIDDGWLDAAATLAVVNVNDHVDPPTAEQLAADGGKHTEQHYRIYMRQRVKFTAGAVADALTRAHPTLMLRGQVETTSIGATRRAAFGEFDFAVIYPPGTAPVNDDIRLALNLDPADPGRHDGLIVFGDAKSWRKLGPLDNGDKRAKVAVQLAVYALAADHTWPAAQPALTGLTVATLGLIVNPPGHGGLSIGKLTRVDIRDARRALTATADRISDALAHAEPALLAALNAGATLDATDPALATQALAAILSVRAWKPSCLTTCPLGQVCRRDSDAGDQTERLGPLAAAAAGVSSISRLHALAHGATPTPTETETAAALRNSRALLGPRPALPWPTPTVPAQPTAASVDSLEESA